MLSDDFVFKQPIQLCKHSIVNTGCHPTQLQQITIFILAGKQKRTKHLCSFTFTPFSTGNNKINSIDLRLDLDPEFPTVPGKVRRIQNFQHDALIPVI